jgi:SAM-dependent methyltransferase
MTEKPRICDYGDSNYRLDFWEGQGRDYEDAVERRVLKRLLPARGCRLLEVGAGFGRITNEYQMFEQVVLLDYSLEQLQYARANFGDEGHLYVAADAYRLPFQPGIFDAATMIRVIHHFENVPAVLGQIRNVLGDNGKFILEYANKRNLKSMLRHLFGLNKWNPYTLDPIEFVELNFNFHPEYIHQELALLGFDVLRVVPVSWFRLGLLKRALPVRVLAALDAMLQPSGCTVSPSVFLDLRLPGVSRKDTLSDVKDALEILRCPRSGAPLRRDGEVLVSENRIRWGIREGVFDFRQPLD